MKKLKQLNNTSNVSSLCQWSGKLEDGKFIYIRYRNGFLGYGIGNTESGAVDNYPVEKPIKIKPDWHILSTKKMLKVLSLKI